MRRPLSAALLALAACAGAPPAPPPASPSPAAPAVRTVPTARGRLVVDDGGRGGLPVLFVHGELDQYLPDFDDLYAAANEPKEAWRLAGVGHTQATEVEPLELQRRVIAFFTRNLA